MCTVRMVHGTIRTVHTTYSAALKTTTHPKTWCRKPYAATQHLMLLMMGVCTQNMSSQEYINKITLLHQVGISLYLKYISSYSHHCYLIMFHTTRYEVLMVKNVLTVAI